MAYGLNISNDSGKLAFSTDYVSLSFVGKFVGTSTVYATSVTVPASFPFPSYETGAFQTWSATFTCVGTPIVFIQSDGKFNAVIRLTNTSGNSWTVLGGGLDVNGSVSSGATFYVFASASASTPAGSYGIKAFDAAGNCTINTSARLLKVAAGGVTTQHDNVTEPALGTTAGVTNVSFGSIPASYAVSSAYVGMGMTAGSPNGVWSFVGTRRISATQFGHGNAQLVSRYVLSASPGTFSVWPGFYILFIDTALYQ